MPTFQKIDEPHIIYDCQSAQVVAFPDEKRTELRFVTTDGKLIAISLSGLALARVRDTIAQLLEERPDIAEWLGAYPQ
jgi:hypothetical protein